MEVDASVESKGSPPTNNVEDSEISETPDTKQSSTPKPVANLTQRQQPDVLCNCPLHCDKKICREWRKIIYRQFHDLDDHACQNRYIQRHIKIKSIVRRPEEDEKIEKKIQRRVTCKYLIPMTGSARESYRYAKNITYDSSILHLDTSNSQQNGFKLDRMKDFKEMGQINADTTNGHSLYSDSPMNTLSSAVATAPGAPKLNGNHLGNHNVPEDKLLDAIQKESMTDVHSPSSFNDNDSIHSPDEDNCSDTDIILTNPVRYVETCQKAFMNMYGITEKRIRWQREKLIAESRYLAELQRKELEEMERTLTLARSLGVGCQPLFAMLEKSNCAHLSEQLVIAIEDDVALVNNFFHNQLWKPEDIMKTPVRLPKLDLIETECD